MIGRPTQGVSGGIQEIRHLCPACETHIPRLMNIEVSAEFKKLDEKMKEQFIRKPQSLPDWAKRDLTEEER